MVYSQLTKMEHGLTELIRVINLGGDGEKIGDELFAVAHLVHSDRALGKAFTDPSRSAKDRQDLAHKLLASSISFESMQEVNILVAERWDDATDLALTLDNLGVDAYLLSAVNRGEVVSLVDQLVSAVQFLSESSREVRVQLSDLGEGNQKDRASLAKKLFSGHISSVAERLIVRAVYTSEYGRLLQTLRSYAERCAQLAGKHLVVVTTAQPLSKRQEERMLNLAERRWDKPVVLVTATNPDMVGGFTMDGGDRAVDTSIRTDIAAARAALTR